MSALTDRLCIQFADDSCVQEGLTHRRGLGALGNLTYTVADIELRQVALAGVPRRVVAVPAFATMRTPGTDEKSMPATERVRGERGLPRYGRLAWVEGWLDGLVSPQVASKAMPIECLNTQNLLHQGDGLSDCVGPSVRRLLSR